MKPKTREIEIHAQAQSFRRGIDLIIAGNANENGDRLIALPPAFEIVPDHLMASPTLSITNEAGQALMDELWACGIRPTEGSGSAGSLAATERHLKDMQSIAFGLLERQGVKR